MKESILPKEFSPTCGVRERTVIVWEHYFLSFFFSFVIVKPCDQLEDLAHPFSSHDLSWENKCWVKLLCVQYVGSPQKLWLRRHNFSASCMYVSSSWGATVQLENSNSGHKCKLDKHCAICMLFDCEDCSCLASFIKHL